MYIDYFYHILGQSLWNNIIWNNPLWQYAVSFIVFLLTLIFIKLFKVFIIRKLQYLCHKTSNKIDELIIEVVASINWGFYFAISFLIAFRLIYVVRWLELLNIFVVWAFVIFYVVKMVEKIIVYNLNKTAEKLNEEGRFEDSKVDPSVVVFLSNLFKLVLWLLVAIIVLENLGYNVKSLAAGLGIGGIAVALAMQNVLGDIFASFSIYFDQPFKVGDFVVFGNERGTVKNIGIKSTRMQTLQGEELIVSNRELTQAQIHNYKKMQRRRIVFNFGVVYSTPSAKLKRVLEIIKEIAENIDIVDLDRVHFTKFGDYSLQFEVVYFLNSNDYIKYMDIQQDINFQIKEKFEKEKIIMAFPTQTIHVDKH